MNRICLDTSAYSHFKRGDFSAVDLVSHAREMGIPAVMLGELRTGFLLGARADENEKELQQFLLNPAVQILQVDEETASIYAQIMVDLRRSGTPLPTNDIWIAALAAQRGLTVVSYDSHFLQIPRVGAKILERSG